MKLAKSVKVVENLLHPTKCITPSSAGRKPSADAGEIESDKSAPTVRRTYQRKIMKTKFCPKCAITHLKTAKVLLDEITTDTCSEIMMSAIINFQLAEKRIKEYMPKEAAILCRNRETLEVIFGGLDKSLPDMRTLINLIAEEAMLFDERLP